jgi:hypothetical protein
MANFVITILNGKFIQIMCDTLVSINNFNFLSSVFIFFTF